MERSEMAGHGGRAQGSKEKVTKSRPSSWDGYEACPVQESTGAPRGFLPHAVDLATVVLERAGVLDDVRGNALPLQLVRELLDRRPFPHGSLRRKAPRRILLVHASLLHQPPADVLPRLPVPMSSCPRVAATRHKREGRSSEARSPGLPWSRARR
eukprot:scaffold3100_cov248-Pinguiococcus_pyrenoidosus.AAC.14